MAKIEYLQPAGEKKPAFAEIIEVRAWDLGGTDRQFFGIGSGMNFSAAANIWLEIIYSVAGAQVFYTRTFLHHYGERDTAGQLKRLDEIAQKDEGEFAFGDMLPETFVSLMVEKSTYKDYKGEERTYTTCKLQISADTGAVLCSAAPGERSVDILLKDIETGEGVRFMRDLVLEIEALYEGKHPDPASFPPGSSEWPFVWQLNRPAYNRISRNYRERYFENSLLTEAFDGWLAQLPPGGRVLDTGCGHGEPVIARLLEKGFQATGADFSPEMLQKARHKFPEAAFVQQSATQLAFEAEFDGACSFSSLLYLDPIDFYQGVLRLHHALKPGGQLFLYGMDFSPGWRGEPLHVVIGEWMWSWHYGMEEAAGRLEEHGYFKVIATHRFVTNEEKEKHYLEQAEVQKQERAEYDRKTHPPGEPVPPSLTIRPERPGYAYLVIARREER
jgi:SAM-dependent methyltransferase